MTRFSAAPMVVWKNSRWFSYTQAAIAYHNDLSAKDLSKDIPVNEGTNDAHAATQVTPQVDDVGNCCHHCQCALTLLSSMIPHGAASRLGNWKPDWEEPLGPQIAHRGYYLYWQPPGLILIGGTSCLLLTGWQSRALAKQVDPQRGPSLPISSRTNNVRLGFWQKQHEH